MTVESHGRESGAGPVRHYELGRASLAATSAVGDLAPVSPDIRRAWLRSLACDAAVYGMPAVLQYEQLHALAVDTTDPSYVGFNALSHDPAPAGPGYLRFRTPNADTLYSHGWVDLSTGPVELHVPAMGDRYYTAHFLDAWSNSVNLSTRTLGPDGGRVWLVTTDWDGQPPSDVRVVRMTTPYQWLLLRVFVRDAADLDDARAMQHGVRLRPHPASGPVASSPWPTLRGAAEELAAPDFFAVLDDALWRNGHPREELAYVQRFRHLGIGAEEPYDAGALAPDLREALEGGHADALALVRSVLTLRGRPAGDGGWRTLTSGSYGFNYLHRAATNYVGLGATVREESGAYTTFVDVEGHALDGQRDYRLRLIPPPPVDAFWSVSAYDADSRHFVPNPLDRYSVNSHTPGLRLDGDGAVLRLSSRIDGDEDANTLPIPPGRFYLVVRAYLGRGPVLDGTWAPRGVEPLR